MNRRHVFTDEEILERARAVFLERGYAGARTKQIASAVGLTWGAIALRFGDKRSLFQRAMAGPGRGTGEAPCGKRSGTDLEGEAPCGEGSGTALGDLLARVRGVLWERWPPRLQYRLATMTAGRDDELESVVHGVAAALQPHARDGTLRSDLGLEMLARLAVALLTGDVAQRFIARERALAADPALMEGVVRLLSADEGLVPAHP
jgi:AcrR family transcriptional regulator